MPSLRISVEGQVFEASMPTRAVRIGSDEAADVRIERNGIAPEHCVIEPLPNGALKVRDANSGRGTSVNGNSIRQVSVNVGDEIQVGDARIRYIADTERVVAPKPKAVAPPPAAAVPAQIVERRRGADRRRPENASVKPAIERRRSVRRVSERPQAADAVVERRTGTDRRQPESASAKPAVERRRSVRRASDRPRADTNGHAASLRARRATKSSPLPWILGAAAVVLVGFALSMMGQGAEPDTSADQAKLESVAGMVSARQYEAARTALESLRNSPSRKIARDARDELRSLNRIERTIKMDLEERWLGRLDLTPDMLARVVHDLRERHGAYGEAHANEFASRVREAQKEWLEHRLENMRSDAAQAGPRHDFVSMRLAWDRLERSAPAGIDVKTVVEEGRAATQAAAAEAAIELEARANEFADKGHRARAVTILENALPGFEGFESKQVLAKAMAAIRVRVVDTEPVATTPDPTQPTPPDPKDAPTPPPSDESVLAAARKAVQEHVEARDFAQGLATAREQGLAGLATDLERAASAFDALKADINANSKKYRNLAYSKSLRMDVIEATEAGFTGNIRGGSSSYRWGRIKKSFFARLCKRWKPQGDEALAGATMLQLVGDTESANALAVKAGETGANTPALFGAIARWRGESVPEGGYVLHEGRYVTPEERERLIREARIAEALAQLESSDAAKRKAGIATLFEIGEPAAKRFRSALDSRRARLIDEIASSKSFTSGKYKKKLFTLLQQRRAHALALIRDAKAYPYPNPQKQNQKEVEDRVDQIRQVWERPFELVVEWDSTLKERLTEVTELDETLSKLDGEYEPDLDVLRDKISKAIDMPAFTPDGKSASARTYSLKVLGFNERLKTTATKEERNNVRAVNDYRMMMGMRTVKINERLTRAARGHSRHMNRNGYFAHNVPGNKGANASNRTPGNRAKTQGYGGGVGENIAMGTWTGYDAFRAWFGSSGHHRNMLGRWAEMGAGRSNGSWWTQLFGGASGRSLKMPDELPDPAPEFAPEPEDDTGRPVGPPGGRVPDEAPPNEGELDEDEDNGDEPDDGDEDNDGN